jgi:hypothetical protein
MLSRRVGLPTLIFFCAGLITSLMYGSVGGFRSYFYENTKIPHHPVPPFQQVQGKGGRA